MKGSVNIATSDVRAAIARFANANVDKMNLWLDDIEDPAKKFELYLRAIEYHIPKLGRMEHTGPDGKALVIERVYLGVTPPK